VVGVLPPSPNPAFASAPTISRAVSRGSRASDNNFDGREAHGDVLADFVAVPEPVFNMQAKSVFDISTASPQVWRGYNIPAGQDRKQKISVRIRLDDDRRRDLFHL
jgi:hypothetical protein